jgi:hypothetical protein
MKLFSTSGNQAAALAVACIGIILVLCTVGIIFLPARVVPLVSTNLTNSGSLPQAFPRFFSFGVLNEPDTASALDDMRERNGTGFVFRYLYLSSGVNTSSGWETWDGGHFAENYMQESDRHGYIPTFVYYNLCQSDGLHPGSYCSVRDFEQDQANLADASLMKLYYASWVSLLKQVRAFNKPAQIIVEPDLWGYLERNSGASDSGANVMASVRSSGFADAAAFPDTAQGFAWALLHMRDKYAPNAILALPASCWATGTDIASDTRPVLDVAGIAQQEAQFLKSIGLAGNPRGVSTWDLVANDIANHDSGQPGAMSWWDRNNITFPNFTRYLSFINNLSRDTHRRVIMWQVPIGNQYFETMNNTPGHYQDNRAEYILAHVPDFAAAGIVAVLFGPGSGGTMNIDMMNDGITNPSPVESYECHDCNTHSSQYPDDDGGYLRIFIGLYDKHPLAIS